MALARSVAAILFLLLSDQVARLRADEPRATTFNWAARLLSPEFRKVDDRRGELQRSPLPEPAPSRSTSLGFHSWPRLTADIPRWVQVDLGQSRPLDAVVLVPAANSTDGGSSFFPVRFRVDISEDDSFRQAVVVADHTAADFPAPGERPVVVAVNGLTARYIRVTTTRMSGKDGYFSFALGELLALCGRRNLAAGRVVTTDSSIDNPPVWHRDYLVDGKSFINPALGPEPSPNNGYHSAIERKSRDAPKWVQVDLGRDRPLEEVVLVPARPRDFPSRLGFGFPVRFRVEAACEPDFKAPIMLFDASAADFPNPGDAPVVVPVHGVAARFVRVTATLLWERIADFIFALAELQVYSDGVNVARDAPVEALDSFEGGLWSKHYLVDGFASQFRLLEWPEWLEQEKRYVDRSVEMAELDRRWEQLREEAFRLLIEAAIAVGVLILLLNVGFFWRSRVLRRREANQLRDRIARDLHDEVGSNLGSILLLCQLARRQNPADVQRDLDDIGRITSQTAESMRDLVWLLSRPVETTGGLLLLLRETASRLLAGVDYTFEVDEQAVPKRLPLEFKRQLQLAFKESLHNVAKHAGATRVAIRCWRSGNQFCLEIHDDGKGFDPNRSPGGTGLRSMRTRVATLKGTFELESQPGQGTTVRMSFPVH